MKLIPASSARWMIRIDSFSSLLPQSPNIMAPRQSGLTYMPVRPSVRCSIGSTLLPTELRRGAVLPRLRAVFRGDGGVDAAGVGEEERRPGVPLGDGVDGGGRVEADADHGVAAGGEVARDRELLGRGAGDAQLAVGASRGLHGARGGGDRRVVPACGLVDDHHETRRLRRLSLCREYEPHDAEQEHGESENDACHTNERNTYDAMLQVRSATHRRELIPLVRLAPVASARDAARRNGIARREGEWASVTPRGRKFRL